MTAMTVSDFVAQSVRHARKIRNWRTADLAAICAAQGDGHLTVATIENIESGRRTNGRRRRQVAVDELFALADALGCKPLDLLPGREEASPPLTLSAEEAKVIRMVLGRIMATPPPSTPR